MTAPMASGVLNVNVSLSEIYDAAPSSFNTLVANDAPRAFTMGDGPFYRALYDVWPRYDASPYRGHYPTTSVPILMLEGTLDPSTLPSGAQEVAAALNGPNQSLVLLSNGAHGNLFQSPLADGSDCAATIFEQFVADPTKALDTSCKTKVLAPNFADDTNAFLFGTQTLWD
jgi:pimeloyl-ACP methyl ester carboxylesterase